MYKKIFLIMTIIFFVGLFFLAGLVAAQTPTPGQLNASTNTPSPTPGQFNASTGGGDFKNPISAGSISALLTNILNKLKGIIITLCVIFIIIGGIMYMLSAGNEKTITRAKACVSGAIIGLVLALGAPVFLKEILSIFGGATGTLNASQLSSYPDLKTVVTRVLSLLLSILGTVAIISLVIGGGMYLTSYGNDGRIQTAKKVLTYSILGIVISLSSLIIVQQIGKLLGAL